jgi:hypothetical protein
LCAKLILRQIAFESMPFYSAWIEDEHGRRPHNIEPMEVNRTFFDMGGKRYEIVVDE